MAATLDDIYTLARTSSFTERVAAAVVKAAVAVAAELPDQSERSRLRRSLSYKVLQDPEEYAIRFALAVATNPVVVKASPDDAIEFTVNSMWDAVAGAEPPAP